MPLIRINYKRIHYRDAPPTNGGEPRETFILSHGLGSSQNYFMPVTPYLCAQGYRCITFDMTGSGRSPYTYVEQTVQSLAQDIIDLMDALSIKKAVLVGHSMSGMSVPAAAAMYPDRVSACVLFGAVYASKEMTPIFEDRIAQVEAKGIEAMAETVPFAAPAKDSQPLIHAMIRELIIGTDPDAYKSLCRVIAYAHKAPPEYSKVKCPVLVVAGEEDKSAPPSVGERIYNEVGTTEKQFVIQKKIGHWMCIEDGKGCSDEIIKFFKQIQ